ncbi:MAG: hypothetical protein HYY17_13430 [Planctomycetes bacterium]|nr:hypothetical protein [Planctomycetota bacterium]
MYIRTKEEALGAMAEVLALPERTQQIIQMSVKIMLCLEPEPRQFLADGMDTLIHDGLDYMRRKRQEALAELQQDSPTAILLVDTTRDDLLERVGTALDALRMAGVAMDVFRDLRGTCPSWKIGRAILTDEAAVRDAMVRGVRGQGGPEGERAKTQLLELIRNSAPDWEESAAAIRALCADATLTPFRGEQEKGLADDDEVLFAVLAMADDRAKLTLDLLASGRGEALEYVGEVRKRIDLLQDLQEREA